MQCVLFSDGAVWHKMAKACVGRDERRRRGRRGRGAARGPGNQQLRALPRRGHPVRMAARAGAAVQRHLRDDRARPAAALAQGRQRALDLLVRRGARLERPRRTRAYC